MTETSILNLETDLREDNNGAYKNALMDEFTQAADKVKKTLNRGVKPDEYAQLNALLNAIEAARSVVEITWKRLHSAKN